MKIQVLDEKENPLLKRKEIIVSLDYNGKATVSKAELQKMLSEELKSSIDSIEISKIFSEVGIPKGRAWVKVWKEKKIPIYSEVKKEKAEKPKEEKPKEQKPEEKVEEAKPKEEKKEEVKE
jgi:ribosomal protein S24E